MNFEQEIHELRKEHVDLNKKIDRILFYLHNDQGTGEDGLVKAFSKHRAEMMEFKKQYNEKEAYKRGKTVAYSAFGGLLVLLGEFIIKAFK